MGLSKLEKLLLGLEIFKRYGQLEISIGDDCIYAGNSNIEMSSGDLGTLLGLGWFIDKEVESWMILV